MAYSFRTLFLVFLASCDFTVAHVALTYPPARKYDLDFLDNSRTKGPCGMPKGSVHTSLLAGSSFNVTWHLAYPHRGGFKLQVLDTLQRPVLDLTPVTADSEFVKNDVTAQAYLVQLPPDFNCSDCTIRLMRQAEEWGKSYRFWSCADVDIMSKNEYKEECSGHGRYLLSKCRCDRLYYGPHCQYKEECFDDNDCGDRGTCIDTEATTAPRKQCYCELGWYGPDCTKRSPVKTMDLDFTAYSKRDLSNTFTLYWRILREQQELEVVMVVNGTSYVGLGWRPRHLTASCRNFPYLEDPFVNHSSTYLWKAPSKIFSLSFCYIN